MTARQSRLDIIKAIIQTQEIGSQEELAQALSKQGVNMTQATLSRDLKLLKVVKGFSPKGRSIYMLPENPYYRRVREHRQTGTAIQNGFMSVRFSGQLADQDTPADWQATLTTPTSTRSLAPLLEMTPSFWHWKRDSTKKRSKQI